MLDTLELTAEASNLAYQLARQELQRTTRELEELPRTARLGATFRARLAVASAASLVAQLEASPDVDAR